jgi:hypothetical protein
VHHNIRLCEVENREAEEHNRSKKEEDSEDDAACTAHQIRRDPCLDLAEEQTTQQKSNKKWHK